MARKGRFSAPVNDMVIGSVSLMTGDMYSYTDESSRFPLVSISTVMLCTRVTGLAN